MQSPARKRRAPKGYQVKYIKMLGLAAVAVIAAMALVGASSASAAVFCLDSACTETKETVKMLSAKGEGKFSAGFVTVECHAVATAKNGILLTLTFAFKECSGCTKVTATVSKASLAATGGGNGVIEGTGDARFEGCPLDTECLYHGAGVRTTLDGSETNALALVVKQSLKKVEGSSALCKETGEWSATFHGETATDKMTFVG